jgi:hypothetical protein
MHVTSRCGRLVKICIPAGPVVSGHGFSYAVSVLGFRPCRLTKPLKPSNEVPFHRQD